MSDSPFVGVISLLLHDIENLLACVGAVLWVAIYSDGLLERADVILAVHVDARPALLRDEANGTALAADDGAHHVALHKQTQREVSGARATGSAATATAAAGSSASSSTAVLLGRFHFHSAAFDFDTV